MNKQNAKDYAEVLKKVAKEFQILIAGRKDFNMKELFELRNYIKSRTDLKKINNKLTNEEKAWKKFYKQIDSLIEQNMATEEKQELDKLENKMNSLEDFQKGIEYLSNLGKEIEKLFIQQFAYIAVHEDKPGENEYKKRKEQMEQLMFNKNLTNEKRIEWANNILKLVDVYKEALIEKLQNTNNKIQKKLAFFERELRKIPSQEEKAAQEILEDSKEWLDLSKETHLARVMATNSILNQVEVDKYLPQRIIKNRGDVKQNLSKEETEEFKNELLTYATLMISAGSKEEEISKRRKPLTQKLFGDVDKEFEQEFAVSNKEIDKTKTLTRNPLEGKAWFRFIKVVYMGLWVVGLSFVVLLASGAGDFWTFVIGAVILWIVLSILKRAFFYIILGQNTYQ